MRDLPRKKLRELIAEHGRSLLHTQSMFGIMLRQQCPQCEPEVRALILALQGGVAVEINTLSDGTPWVKASEPWVRRLADSGNLSEEEARWVVDSWGLALGKHPDAISVPRDLPPAVEKPWVQPLSGSLLPPARSFWASAGLWQLILVALAGLAGGLVPAVEVWLTPDDPPRLQENPHAKPEGGRGGKINRTPARS